MKSKVSKRSAIDSDKVRYHTCACLNTKPYPILICPDYDFNCKNCKFWKYRKPLIKPLKIRCFKAPR